MPAPSVWRILTLSCTCWGMCEKGFLERAEAGKIGTFGGQGVLAMIHIVKDLFLSREIARIGDQNKYRYIGFCEYEDTGYDLPTDTGRWTSKVDHATCEDCKDAYALWRLGDLP